MYFIGKNVHFVGNAKKTLKKIWKVFIKSPYLQRTTIHSIPLATR